MPDPLQVVAAGSLKAALTAYAANRPGEVQLVFGPAGLLRERIEAGQACDVFLSANMAHADTLARAAGAASRCFARNRLCVVARPDTGLRADTLLDQMLDPALRLGTSTPGADPSGDYAQALFRRADAMRPGAGAALRDKAVAVVGGSIPAPGAPAKEGGIAQLLAGRTIDAFICYRSSALAMPPGVVVVVPPPDLAITAEYGLVVLRPGTEADAFADGLLGPAGRAHLLQHGFDAP